jgi:hypothetical protein
MITEQTKSAIVTMLTVCKVRWPEAFVLALRDDPTLRASFEEAQRIRQKWAEGMADQVLKTVAVLLVVVFWAHPVLAQDGAPVDHNGAQAPGLCLLIGAGISLLIASLKSRVSFIRNNPKLTATFLAAIIATVEQFTSSAGPSWGPLLTCTVLQLGTAIGTHEVALKPMQRALEPESDKVTPGRF